MKRRADTASAALDESLQADVMRFMAIIAFCLVAIMALARNATPLGAEDGEVAAEAERVVPRPDTPAPVTPVAPAVLPDDVAGAGDPEVPQAISPPAEVIEARPVVTETASGVRPESLSPRPEVLEPAMAEPVLEPASPPELAEAQKPAPAPAPAPGQVEPRPSASERGEAETGLSLRFASDVDFLRLVSREAIEVYAFREGEVLALSPGLRFAAARAPGPVHELLPTTIPAPIVTALADLRRDVEGFRWGVRMPGRIERQVREHVDAGSSGVLVIDRFGEVRLLAHTTEGESKG